MAASIAELAAQYGFSSAFFSADPELAQLMKNAVSAQWTTEKFQANFMNTAWYRARQASVRQWADLNTRDPAEAIAKVNQKKLEFADMASQFGVTLDDAALTNFAISALQYQWSGTQTKDVFTSLAGQTGFAGGTPAALGAQVKHLANDYGLTLTSAQQTDYVSGMLSERYTEDNLRSFMTDMAKSRYTGMAPYLDMGLTVKQVASPYMSSYANLMEVDADGIDMQDPTIQQALQGVPAAPNQPPQMQSVYQFEKNLRRDPRWLKTKNAQQSVTSAGQSVLRDWGLVA